MTQTVMNVSQSGIVVECRECGMRFTSSKEILKQFRFTCKCCHGHRFRRVLE